MKKLSKYVPLFLPLLGALLIFAPVTSSQSATKSGVRGRIVIAKEFLAKKMWPIEGARAHTSRGPTRVRRPAGFGPLKVQMEPAPALTALLLGAKEENPVEKEIVFEGLRFSPGTLLISGMTTVKVTNRHSGLITLKSNKGVLTSIEPGASKSVSLDEGKALYSAKEFPFAQVELFVVEKAKALSIKHRSGLFDEVLLEPGDYKLAFYHGATPFIVQEITVPPREFIAIDATISANRVATVSVKDGGLRTLKIAPRPKPTPPKQKKPTGDGEEVDREDIE